MKQTLIRLMLIAVFFLLFVFIFHKGIDFALLLAFVITYILEGIVSQLIR